MDYDSAMEFIASTYKLGSKLGLTRIGDLLGHMGNPQDRLKYIHVAGTNGKGSTVAFISNILIKAGYRVGVFTSPHISRFSERITVNGEEISGADIGRLTGVIKEKVAVMESLGQGCPTEFEVVTALGLSYYYERGCDIVVLETGLGGRLDSTNIIKTAEVSVITAIDYDHTAILGNTLPEIAAEKAGIIKQDGRVVLYPQALAAEEVIAGVCAKKNARLYRLGEVVAGGYDPDGQSFDFNGYKNLRIALLSGFQCQNAAVAVMAAELLRERGFSVCEEHVRAGLLSARWPGRFEIVNREPVVVVDGAHNAHGASHLAADLTRYFPSRDITFIVGVLEDKDYKGIVSALVPIAARFIATQPDSPRALAAEKLARYLRAVHPDVHTAAQPKAAVEAALGLCGGGVICSLGSLFYVGDIRGYFSMI